MSFFQYSEKYADDMYEYRHVIVAAEKWCLFPKGRMITEKECRELGVQQSPGWIHYMIHRPEPHVLLFRRLLAKNKN